MYRCSLCSYTTRFESYMRRHSFVHTSEKSITCNLCGSKFKEQCAYRLHMKEKHGPRAHVCRICGLAFTYQRVLDRHLLCHEDIKRFSCSVCGYKCKRKHDLIQHTRAMHSPNKPRRKTHEEATASIFVSSFSSASITLCIEFVSTLAGPSPPPPPLERAPVCKAREL